jgi:beta-galactosidase
VSKEYAFEWIYTGMAYDLQRSLQPLKPIYESEWHGIQTAAYANTNIPAPFINASLWFSYLHGVNMNVTWWWSRLNDLPRGDGRWFDGSMGAQPQVMDQWARTNITVQRHVPQIILFQDDAPRIRLLYSQPSAIFNINYLNTLRHSYEGLSWFGRPVGYVSETMLLDGFDKLNLLVVPAANYVSPGVRQSIAKLAEKGVTVVFIGDDCLAYSRHGKKLADPVPIAAIHEKQVPDEPEWARLLMKAAVPMDLHGVGSDGKTSKPVAFQWVKQSDGQYLAYIIGLGSKPAAITIEKNGKAASYVSLLNGKVYEGARPIEPFEFDLIRLK